MIRPESGRREAENRLSGRSRSRSRRIERRFKRGPGEARINKASLDLRA